ncbi:MAG: hypothetical protein HY539_05040 [Deltaproteobacteria bacterium]|nr:hypothetical protein [Deltaproteobacteria bacterium]MBI4197169.1 hypothetical protein [Deltaproteobacteria bacterium]
MAITEFISGGEGAAGLASGVIGDFVRPHQPSLRPSVALPRTAADFFVAGKTDPRGLFLVSADDFQYRIDHLRQYADDLQSLLSRGLPGGFSQDADAVPLLRDIVQIRHLNEQLGIASGFLRFREVRGWFRLGHDRSDLAVAWLERSPYKDQFDEVLRISRELAELLQTRHGIAVAANSFPSPVKETVFMSLYRGLQTALGKSPSLAVALLAGSLLAVEMRNG